MSQSDEQGIYCTDGCKRVVNDQAEALAKAWHFLQIAKRWRCPDCARALDVVNKRDRNAEG